MITIVTPAVSARLTSETRAHERLALPVEVAVAPYLKGFIDAASAAIVGYCGRSFARETVTETVRSLGSGPIILSRSPIVGNVSVLLDGAAVAPADLECDRSSGLLYHLQRSYIVGWRGRGAAVTYTTGWIVPEDPAYATAAPADRLPADVEQACLILVGAYIASVGRDPMLRSESTDGVGSASYIATADMGALPPQAAALLAPYRVYSVS
ncbi:hypothetical protein [Roseomonas xinghualingensis]|uniref:hypothetical protein n=1 Tax=Roseomonas xinghualingensis TaxID=2986475 RepID=UPI0021F187B8|nr:hypothetical protein [Roseomonas sp. SXEYE001]MCV4209893.1 hypothetical protein [Roseomonas sp. SXEYE001]